MMRLQRNIAIQTSLAVLCVFVLGLLVCPVGASDLEKDVDKLCAGWGDDDRRKRSCVVSVERCIGKGNRGRTQAQVEQCMHGIVRVLPPGTDWRAALAGDGPEGKATLHGSYSGGLLRCDRGYYRNDAGDDCIRLPEVTGGKWLGKRLFCHDGYIRMVEGDKDKEDSPTHQSCRKLPEIANAVYRATMPACTTGYALVDGPECAPQSTVRDPSLLLSPTAWRKYMCPEGYRESAGTCFHTGLKAKTARAGGMELQGIRLGMGEDEIRGILEAKGYSKVSYGFMKKEPNGTKKVIEYKVGVAGSQDPKYRRLVHIKYKQDYPTSLRFDIAEIEAKMKERFGEPDRQKKKSDNEFSLSYRDGGMTSNMEPIFTVNARKDFRGQSLWMALQDPGLQQRLLDEHRAEAAGKKQQVELAKPAANIDF